MDKNKNEFKKEGIFRLGAIVPSAIFFLLLFSYFFFFFDGHLKRGLEFIASKIHGAEVNIGSLHTSLFRASFELRELQVTNKDSNGFNLFEIGEIRFHALWHALLRAKLVIEEASLLNIQAHTKRKKAGYVYPPSSDEDGLLAKIQNQGLKMAKDKVNENFLGDIIRTLEGMDPKEQLKNIQGDLKTNQRALQLEKEISAKKLDWEKRIKGLPKPSDLKLVEEKIKSLDLKTKNPIELAKNLKRAKEILGEAEEKFKLVEKSHKDLNEDLQQYTRAISGLQEFVEKDVLDLQKRLQIPSMDPKEISSQLFFSQVSQRLGSLQKYVAIGRKLMPPPKSAEEIAAAKREEILPRARGQGLNFSFPITHGYPVFWLKKANVSSTLNQSEWAGEVSGLIQNLTTSPSQIALPLRAEIRGNFPKKEIKGFHFLAVLDHTKSTPKETLMVKLDSFPVQPFLFSQTDQLRFGLNEAQGASKVDVLLEGEKLRLNFQSRFSKPVFLLETKNKKIQELLGSVLKEIPALTLEAQVTGSFADPSFQIDSNLGRELSAGLGKQLKGKLGESRAKLESFVNEKVGSSRKNAQDQLSGLSGGPGKSLENLRSLMEKTLQSLRTSALGGGNRGGGFLKGLGF